MVDKRLAIKVAIGKKVFCSLFKFVGSWGGRLIDSQLSHRKKTKAFDELKVYENLHHKEHLFWQKFIDV